MKLNNKRTVCVGLAFLSICAFWQVYDNLIPLILKNTFGINDGLIGIVMALDNVLALFMLPLFGKLSDKTRTKLGRRMPYILVGSAVALLCLLLLPLGERTASLPLFLLGLGLVLVAMATYRSPAVALMPDVTPKPLRSKANAIINLMGAIGGALMLVVMTQLPGAVEGQPYRPNYIPIFVILGLLMAVCIALLVWKINEPQCVSEMEAQSAQYGVPQASADAPGAATKLSGPERRSLLFILSSVVLWFFGYNAVTSAFSRYAVQELQGNFANVLLMCTVAAIVAYIPVGHIASRIGRKKTILIGIVMLTSAFFAGIFFHAVTPALYVFFAFAGFGWAFINVNSYPMVVELAGDGDVGKYTGYYYTVSMSAQTATPILSGFLMDWSYRTLFPYATLFVAASFITMLFVHHGDAKPIPKKGLEALDVDD